MERGKAERCSYAGQGACCPVQTESGLEHAPPLQVGCHEKPLHDSIGCAQTGSTSGQSHARYTAVDISTLHKEARSQLCIMTWKI